MINQAASLFSLTKWDRKCRIVLSSLLLLPIISVIQLHITSPQLFFAYPSPTSLFAFHIISKASHRILTISWHDLAPFQQRLLRMFWFQKKITWSSFLPWPILAIAWFESQVVGKKLNSFPLLFLPKNTFREIKHLFPQYSWGNKRKEGRKYRNFPGYHKRGTLSIAILKEPLDWQHTIIRCICCSSEFHETRIFLFL